MSTTRVESNANQNNLINISDLPNDVMSTLPDDVMYCLFSAMLQTNTGIYPLLLTNKRCYELIVNHPPFLSKVIAFYRPDSFKLNPNHPNPKGLFAQFNNIDKNYRTRRWRLDISKLHPDNVNYIILNNGKPFLPGIIGYTCAVQHKDKVFIGADKDIKVFDFNSGKELHSFTAHAEQVAALALADEKLIAYFSDGCLKLWDLNHLESGQKTPTYIAHLPKPGSMNKGLAVDGSKVFCTSDKQIHVYDLKNEAFIDFGSHDEEINCLAAQDGILCSGANDIKIWDASTRGLLHTLTIFKSKVTCLKIHDRRLISGDDSWITIWDIKSGKQLCSFCANFPGISTKTIVSLEMQNGRLYSGCGRKIKVFDFDYASLSLYNAQVLEDNLTMLAKMVEAQGRSSAEEVTALSSTLHPHFQERLKQHAYRLSKCFIPTTEAILSTREEVCIELLLDRIHGEDLERIGEILEMLEQVDDQTKCAFKDLLNLQGIAFQDKEEAVLKFKEFLKGRWGEDLPLFLVDLGIDSKETFSKVLECTPDTLEKVGILSIEDLNPLGILTTPVFKQFEIPKEEQGMDAHTQSYHKRDAVSNALQEVSEEIRKRLQESQRYGAYLFVDTKGSPIAQELNPWVVFQEEFEAEKRSIEEKCASPKCDYAKIVEAANALRDKFNAHDREYQITKIRAYIHQVNAQQTWRALKEEGVSSLNAFAKKNPDLNLFTIG